LHTLMTDPGVARRYRLDGVITTVDAVNGLDTLDRQLESLKQAAVADRLLLTKTDLADADVLRALRERLRALNPAAPQIVADHGQVDPAELFDAGLYNPETKSPDVQAWLRAEAYDEHHHHHHHDHEGHAHGHSHEQHDVNRHDAHIKAHCLTLDEPIPSDALEAWLEALLMFRGENFLRIKGIINVAELDGPMVIHGVQHILHPPVQLESWPSEDRRSRIVFITRDIDEALIRNTLGLFTKASADRSEPASYQAEGSGDVEVPR
ncbi:MAG: GTP-binding protein, partial [Pseudomonadota bacterium]